MPLTRANTLLAAAIALALSTAAPAAVTDFTNWTLVQDPPSPSFTASATAAQASLFAGGAAAVGTDIGYQSIDGNTVATSAAGYYFDPASDFTIAIDYDLSFVSASGALGLGFGVGEDGAGEDSVGVALLTVNGAPLLTFGAAARVNDASLAPQTIALNAALTGSLFVAYNAASGDIVLGASQTQAAASPTATTTFAGLQNQWSDAGLLASFFIRSDAIPIVAESGWTGGDATAAFTNFRVLEGSPALVPEPASLALIAVGAGIILRRRTR